MNNEYGTQGKMMIKNEHNKKGEILHCINILADCLHEEICFQFINGEKL